MSGHAYHDNTTKDCILYDGCDRCSEHAEHPIESLDLEHLHWLWDKMIKMEIDEKEGLHYASIAERMAAKKLYPFALLMERFGYSPRGFGRGPLAQMLIFGSMTL